MPSTISDRNCTGQRCNGFMKRFSKLSGVKAFGQLLLRMHWVFSIQACFPGSIRPVALKQSRLKKLPQGKGVSLCPLPLSKPGSPQLCRDRPAEGVRTPVPVMQRVVITGVSTGIGHASVKVLLKRGFLRVRQRAHPGRRRSFAT
jgi:hypothetical protein